MYIRVENLHVRPRQIEISEPVEKFPALVAFAEQGDVVFTGKITGTLTASMAGDAVRVEGHLAALAVLSCSRCLCDVQRAIDIPVSLYYHNTEASPGRTADIEELELTLRDMELIPFRGDEIDPEPEIAQELIMALPQAVLCREECAGLCPFCGCDQNNQSCECEKPILHEGLARLKDLKIDRE